MNIVKYFKQWRWKTFCKNTFQKYGKYVPYICPSCGDENRKRARMPRATCKNCNTKMVYEFQQRTTS